VLQFLSSFHFVSSICDTPIFAPNLLLASYVIIVFNNKVVEFSMQSSDVPSLEARQKLGELLERVYYQNAQFRITRKEKPMAWLVSEPFMETVVSLIDYVIDREPAIADTLALMVNSDAQQVLEQGTEELRDGKLVSLDSILDL
jgi:hypothetical protein